MRQGFLNVSGLKVPGTYPDFCRLQNSVLYLACFYVPGAEYPT
jgi:hypothetical protein